MNEYRADDYKELLMLEKAASNHPSLKKITLHPWQAVPQSPLCQSAFEKMTQYRR